MQRFGLLGAIALLLSTFALFGFGRFQEREIDQKQLRDMLTQLGYEVKDLVTDPGKEKYSVSLERDGLTIPVGFELSGNKNYVWLTVNLGEVPTAEASLELLKQNAKIQPSHFYITSSNRLMMAVPIENRGVTNALIRSRMDTLAGNVARTESFWKKKP